MQGVNVYSVSSLRGSALLILEFNAPFCLGETHHYFKQCDLFHSSTLHLNSLYRHPNWTLIIDKALRNIIVSAYRIILTPGP